jgi:hypothetical protein
MGELECADVEVVGGELDDCSALALQEADKTRRRNVGILQDYSARPKAGKPITVRFRSSVRRSSCSATRTATSVP